MKEWLAIFKEALRLHFGISSKEPVAEQSATEDSAPAPVPVTPVSAEERLKKQEFFFELMARRLELQSRTVADLNNQAGIWLSGTGLLIAFPGLLLAAERNDLDTPALHLIGFAAIIYIVGLILVFFSPIGRRWLDGPHWQDLANVAAAPVHDASDMYYSVGYALAATTLVSNKKKLTVQYIVMYTGVSLVIAGVALLFGTAIWNLPAHHSADAVRVIIVTATP